MKKKLFHLYLLFSIFLGVFSFCTRAYASNGLKFSVTPNIPENQINKQATYFDLLLDPNQTQQISVTLKNSNDSEVTVLAKINSAITNSEGLVEYSNFDNKERIYDESLKFNIEDLIELNEESIMLKPGEEKEVVMTIHMPPEKFDGVIAGGIYLKQQDEESNAENSGTSIKNLFGYEIAVLLRNSVDTIDPIIEYDGAKANQVNVRNAISLTVRNISPTYINKVSFNAELKKDGEEDSVASVDKENMQIAPNTIFDLYVPMNGKRFEPGNYVLTGSISSEENDWPFSEKFTITKEQAEEYNKTDPDIEPKDYTLVIVLSSISTILALIIAWLLIRNYKQKKKLKKAIDRKNKKKRRKVPSK